MPLAQNVPADKLINAIAEYLKDNVKEVSPPEWSLYTKTGPQVSRVPSQSNFWYVRSASLLRRLYIEGPVGIERLRTLYGARTKNGMKNEHFVKTGGSSIRKVLQQLEGAGLVAKASTKGRVLTDKGTSTVDRIAYKLIKDLQKDMPELNKYIPIKAE
ncbi:MAG: 30S ribosomal protein S19e [Candidatus Methanomethylicus sp.]|nr:30S ribosomal protein S19e [Candidatus Methanomethylicus sp.]